jgi:hypothetical protein
MAAGDRVVRDLALVAGAAAIKAKVKATRHNAYSHTDHGYLHRVTCSVASLAR